MSAWAGAVIFFGTAISSLVARWMVLRFLQRVYDRGGAKDLKVAAEALRETRSWSVVKDVAQRSLRRGT